MSKSTSIEDSVKFCAIRMKLCSSAVFQRSDVPLIHKTLSDKHFPSVLIYSHVCPQPGSVNPEGWHQSTTLKKLTHILSVYLPDHCMLTCRVLPVWVHNSNTIPSTPGYYYESADVSFIRYPRDIDQTSTLNSRPDMLGRGGRYR